MRKRFSCRKFTGRHSQKQHGIEEVKESGLSRGMHRSVMQSQQRTPPQGALECRLSLGRAHGVGAIVPPTRRPVRSPEKTVTRILEELFPHKANFPYEAWRAKPCPGGTAAVAVDTTQVLHLRLRNLTPSFQECWRPGAHSSISPRALPKGAA